MPINNAGAPEIIDTNNYYPFGLSHISGMLSTSNFGSFYSYKYNGKELQETGMFDYGARMYMPDLGRWGVIDPLAEASRRFTPYHYGNNNPIRFIDPDGRLTVDNLQGGYSTGSAVADFMFRTGLSSDERNMPLFYRNEGGAMIRTEALGNDGQGGGGDSKPSFGRRAWNWISNLFGGKKKGTIEVGQLEKIPFEEEKISAADIGSILLNALLGGTDPYMVIGNSGIGPYAEERENVGAVAMIFINPEAAAEGLERKALSRAAMSKIWGAGLEYELKTVLHPGALEKTIEKNWGKNAVEAFDNIIDQLANGKAGGNIHSLNKELKGYKAIDIPGTGAGRGAGRVIFKDSPNQVEIIGIVKGHDYNNILK